MPAPAVAALMIACLFAGVGAWAAKVEVLNAPMYASELFGEGHAAIKYPTDLDPDTDGNQDGTPMVVLTIPANVAADPTATPPVEQVSHNGSARITFTLSHGTFMSNITGLEWNTGADGADDVAAPGTVATIVSGGRAEDNKIEIEVKEAAEANDTAGMRAGAFPGQTQTISFKLPRLQGLDHLGGAKPMEERSVKLHVDSRVVSGAFTDGKLSSKGRDPKAPGEPVVKSRDSLTLMMMASGDGGATKTIAIEDDEAKSLSAFKSIKENKDGYVELATVVIATQQVSKKAVDASGEVLAYYIDDDGKKTAVPDGGTAGDCTSGTDDTPGCYNRAQAIFEAATSGNKTEYYTLLDLDGNTIDEGLRGNFMVNAEGTRELFNEKDRLFVDYDGDGKMGGSEEIVIDGDMTNMAAGHALSIDSDESKSFPDGITGNFKVYYMPGGKDSIRHAAQIKLTAMVDYSDPTAKDETPVKSETTLNFDGVTSEAMAYAIPHAGNTRGDIANVRVRCQSATPCRVFLECWDDMGNRAFGGDNAPLMVAGNSVARWSAAQIEDVVRMEAESRLSCRVLSKGAVTVQQLTRSNGTLVNNTYVGGG